MSEAIRCLQAIDPDEPQRAREVVPVVYEELRKPADARLAHEPSEQTLQTTVLVR